MTLHLTLFGTAGCHLCEEAEHLLGEYNSSGRNKIVVRTIDVAEQEDWHERYALRIPVLSHPQSGLELAWPFDGPQLAEFIARIGSSLP